MKKLLFLTLILILSAGFITSCKKKDKGDPPVLPPQESMSIDFSNFTTLKKSADLVYEQKGVENSNWEFAALVAGFWKLIINATLIVPVSAFKVAINQTPVYLDNKTWQWSFNVTVANVTYKARLTGQIRASDVLWEMYIKEGTSVTEFLWFEGTSNLNGQGGQWILNESSQIPGALIQIDWTKTGASIASIKYTYVKNDANKTSFIEYGLTSSDLNAYYTVHYFRNPNFSDVFIEYNTTAHNGRVKSLDYLVGDTWYCWNGQKINITCP